MRIDMKRNAEVAKRKGLANRTAFAILALFGGFVVAYVLTSVLFSREVLKVNFFYNELHVPRDVSEGIIYLAVAFLFTFFFQFIAIMVYALANPTARERPGTPTAVAKDPDYYETYRFSD